MKHTHTHPWFSGHVWFSFPIWGHHFAGAGEVIAGATRLRMIKDHEIIIRSPFFETETYGVPLLQWNMLILYLYLSSFLAKLCGDLFSVTFYLGWRSCATGLSENSSRDFLSMDCTKILVPRILHRSGFLLLCSKKTLSEASKCLTAHLSQAVDRISPGTIHRCLRSMDWLGCCTGSPK